eukprot:231847-Hanusia_phi.AAC.1
MICGAPAGRGHSVIGSDSAGATPESEAHRGRPVGDRIRVIRSPGGPPGPPSSGCQLSHSVKLPAAARDSCPED